MSRSRLPVRKASDRQGMLSTRHSKWLRVPSPPCLLIVQGVAETINDAIIMVGNHLLQLVAVG